MQEHLLRAGLLPAEAGLGAWRDWQSRWSLEDLDQASLWLLPLVHHNLIAFAATDPALAQLKNLHRVARLKTLFLMEGVAPLVHSLAQADIGTMLLKGAALVLTHYRDPGLRPMTDLDLLVPTEQASVAIDHLMHQGWQPITGVPDHERLTLTHAAPFRGTAQRLVDLHWHMLDECLHPEADADFWNGAVQVELSGCRTKAPNPADLLLQTCAHGTRWSAFPPCRWVADVAFVLRTSGASLDWDRLVDQARKRRLVLPVREGLGYVRRLLDAPVPDGVLERLEAARTTTIDRLAFQARTRAPHLRGPLLSLGLHSAAYVRLRESHALPPGASGLSAFAKLTWRAESLWQVPLMAVGKGLRRARQLLAWHTRRLSAGTPSNSLRNAPSRRETPSAAPPSKADAAR